MENFINFLIEIQNKILNKKTSKRISTLGFGASLCFTSKLDKTKEKLEKDVCLILKKCNNNPKEIIKFIESKGTKVYRINHAEKMFKSISQEIGFIPEAFGIKAFLINFLVSCNTNEDFKAKFKTNAMFILDKNSCDTFWFIQQFYKWYAMKLNLPGYNAKAQECFNSFMSNCSDAKIKALSVDEILDLKDAIARDIESINFVVELAKATVDSKSASAKITTGGAMI
jgi:hypothetical protein